MGVSRTRKRRPAAAFRLGREFAEARPGLAELRRMVRRLKLAAIAPLDIAHQVVAVLAAVQAD